MDFQLLAQLRLIGRAAESAAEAGRRLRDNSPESTRLAFNMQDALDMLGAQIDAARTPRESGNGG